MFSYHFFSSFLQMVCHNNFLLFLLQNYLNYGKLVAELVLRRFYFQHSIATLTEHYAVSLSISNIEGNL